MATSTWNRIAAETGADLLQSFRAPEFWLPTLLLPSTFYFFFGVLLARGGGTSAYLLATYGIFAVMGPALFAFGAGVANERERGWLDLKRAAPAPASGFIVSKLLATLAFAALALLPVYAAAGFVGGVALPTSRWLLLLGVHLAAVLPFALLGLTLGFRFGANGAIASANIVFLGLALLGGLWFPITLFPGVMQLLAQALPSYHLSQVALIAIGAIDAAPVALHAGAAAAMTVAFGGLAAWSATRAR